MSLQSNRRQMVAALFAAPVIIAAPAVASAAVGSADNTTWKAVVADYTAKREAYERAVDVANEAGSDQADEAMDQACEVFVDALCAMAGHRATSVEMLLQKAEIVHAEYEGAVISEGVLNNLLADMRALAKMEGR